MGGLVDSLRALWGCGMLTRQCSTCREVKPIEEFGLNRSRKHGHQYVCKFCYRTYHREYQRKLRKVKGETVREYYRQYERTSKAKTWRRQYVQTEKGRKLHRAANKASRHRRRVLIYGKRGNVSPEEWATVLEMYTDHRGTMCAYCYKIIEKPTMDHIEPLAGGGRHEIENVVPACGSCNSSKGAKPLLRWMYDKQIAA